MQSVFDSLKKALSPSNHFEFVFVDECASSNDLAKTKKLTKPHAFFTNHQTAGRGQNTNRWTDNKGQCLLMTLAWPGLKTVPPPETTLDFGKMVAENIQKIWPALKIHVKAPNDIYLEILNSTDRKKAGGILMETVGHTSDWTLLFGFGLNVLGEPFEPSTSISKNLLTPITQETLGNFVTNLIESCHNFVATK